MPNPESEGREKKVLVRGADGALYVLTKTKPPEKLTEEEVTKVTKIVKKAEENLADILEKEVPRLDFSKEHSVRITIPEVFTEQ